MQKPPEEVIAFRKRFGIAADGTMLRPMALPGHAKVHRAEISI